MAAKGSNEMLNKKLFTSWPATSFIIRWHLLQNRNTDVTDLADKKFSNAHNFSLFDNKMIYGYPDFIYKMNSAIFVQLKILLLLYIIHLFLYLILKNIFI